jgi:hypothetical protein
MSIFEVYFQLESNDDFVQSEPAIKSELADSSMYTDTQSSEYLSEHESNREFVEEDESQQDSEEYNPSQHTFRQDF